MISEIHVVMYCTDLQAKVVTDIFLFAGCEEHALHVTHGKHHC